MSNDNHSEYKHLINNIKNYHQKRGHNEDKLDCNQGPFKIYRPPLISKSTFLLVSVAKQHTKKKKER